MFLFMTGSRTSYLSLLFNPACSDTIRVNATCWRIKAEIAVGLSLEKMAASLEVKSHGSLWLWNSISIAVVPVRALLYMSSSTLAKRHGGQSSWLNMSCYRLQ